MDDLKLKFPASKICNEPLADCPQCKGKGTFINGTGLERPCICVHLSTNETALRLLAVTSFRKTIDSLKKEARET